jgi:hypothetical protein
LFRAKSKSHFGTDGRGERRGQKIWKTPYHRKKLFSSPKPLKKIKTAKEMFAKIWRKQAFFWKNLPKKLGGGRACVTAPA